MINELRNELNNIIKRDRFYYPKIIIEKSIIYLIYLKYLCEIKKYEYEQVIISQEVYDIVPFSNSIKKMIDNQVIALNSLLRNYTGVKARDLLLQLIDDTNEKAYYYSVTEEKILYLFKNAYDYANHDYSIYDKSGKTTYISDDENDLYEYFIIFDEILGVHNNYKNTNEIDYQGHDNLCIYYDVPKYLHADEELFDYIYKVIKIVKNVYLYAKYSKISSLKNGGFAIRSIKTIIIKNNNVVIIFKKGSDEISIINGNNPKVSNSQVLDDIINKNRKQKDLLVKTNYEELRKNGMRIGFNLYQMEKDDGFVNINKIVDENTRYLRRLNSLNETVEEETNKLFNL